MKEYNEIIEFSKEIINNVENIDDLIDNALEPIKDYTDTLGDIITPIKSIYSIISLRRKIALKEFLRTYSKCLTDNYELNEKESNKLKEYFKKSRNLEFISEIIDNGIYSKSLKSSAILGLIAGETIKNKKAFNNKDLIIIESLKNMNDFDIINFTQIIENIEDIKNEIYPEQKEIFDIEFRIFQIHKSNIINIEKEDLELTIEKLKKTGVLTYGQGGIGSVGNARGAFMLNRTSLELFEIIKKSNV